MSEAGKPGKTAGRAEIWKFGGASLADAGAVRRAASLIAAHRGPLLVVASALAGVTDALLDGAKRSASGDADAGAEVGLALHRRHRLAVESLLPPGPARWRTIAILDGAIQEYRDVCRAVAALGDLSPRASDLQFIDQDRVWAAQTREITAFDDEPLIVGVDFSGGGKAWNTVRFRRGMDARTIPAIRVSGDQTRADRSSFLSLLAGILAERSPAKKVSMMFCDSAYGAPYVERLRTMGFSNVQEVNFGGPSPDDRHYGNMRAYMWSKKRDWLLIGAIPKDDKRLEADLTAPGQHLDRKDRKFLESKESMAKRGVASPDDADALALTFAAPVQVKGAGYKRPVPKGRFTGRGGTDGGGLAWMG